MMEPDEEFEWPADKDVEDVIAGLDLATLTPEDIEDLDQSSQGSDPSSKGGASVDGNDEFRDAASVSSGQSEQKSVTSDLSGLENVWMEDTATGQCEPVTDAFASHPAQKEEKKNKVITKNPFKYIKRKLSKGDVMAPLSIAETDLTKIRVDSLPQHFVTKYLGCLPAAGVQGIKFIRKPVDTMVKKVTMTDKKKELPLVQLTVWGKGIQATIHPKTTCRDFEPHVLPVEYISYAVQDTKYYKIVAFIVVTELTPKTQKVECHAYICDSSQTARKLTLSVAKAFQIYAGKLDGNKFEFKVDLRTPEEIKQAKRKSKGPDCDA